MSLRGAWQCEAVGFGLGLGLRLRVRLSWSEPSLSSDPSPCGNGRDSVALASSTDATRSGPFAPSSHYKQLGLGLDVTGLGLWLDVAGLGLGLGGVIGVRVRPRSGLRLGQGVRVSVRVKLRIRASTFGCSSEASDQGVRATVSA